MAHGGAGECRPRSQATLFVWTAMFWKNSTRGHPDCGQRTPCGMAPAASVPSWQNLAISCAHAGLATGSALDPTLGGGRQWQGQKEQPPWGAYLSGKCTLQIPGVSPNS